MGELHYNLYRSQDQGSYEKIAQFPFPGFWSHVRYFDPINDMEYSCYNYKVTLTVCDEYGHICESHPAPNAENPLIDWAEVCNTWQVEETTADETVLYPNPTTGRITIEMEDFSHVEVYDFMGRLMKQSKQATLDLGRLPQGFYVVKIVDLSGNRTIRKVIKD